MPSPFDGLQATTFAATTATFGYEATWRPSAGGPALTARVHFKNPTNPERVGEVGASPIEPSFEFLPEQFPGLFESVRGGTPEAIAIEGVSYTAVACEALADGRTYLAKMEVIL